MTQDRLLASEEKVKELRKAKGKAEGPLQDKPIDHQEVQDPLEHIVDQPGEVEEVEEKVEESELKMLEKICENYFKNDKAIERFTSMSRGEFMAFVEECSPALGMTTYMGTTRLLRITSTWIPGHAFIFLTLFWLRHYPTIDILLVLFQIHERSCTRILKWTVVAMANTLANEIQFPSDKEMEGLQYTAFQNFNFPTCVCVVDGTEIRIS